MNDERTSDRTADTGEKRFHGWRLLGVVLLVVLILAGVAFVIDWAIIGPLEGRVF